MTITETISLICFTFGGFIAAYICNLLLLRFSESLGIRNKNDVTIRWNNLSKPSLGGVSFFVVFIFFCFVYSILFPEDALFTNRKYIGLFTAGTLAFSMGLADDAYNTRPLLKLTAQILCGLIIIYTGTIIHLTSNIFFNKFLTVFWVVLLMNSLNMLDNMDGITGTVVLFILVACLGSNWLINGLNDSIWSTLICTIIGGIIGFLSYNIHPSKLFMGDAGSQFIGFFVSFITIDNLWLVGNSANLSFNYIGVLLVIICFTVPFSDTLSVVINRIRKGKSPMVGGKDHTTHHLVYSGLNDKQVWVVFLILSATAAVLTLISIYSFKVGGKFHYFIPLFSLIVFIYLFSKIIKYKGSI